MFGSASRASTLAWGSSSDSSSSRFGISLRLKVLMPVRLPPGRLRLATRPSATGSVPTAKTIGIVEVAFFAASAVPPAATIASNLAGDQLGSQGGQPIETQLRPAVFDHHILPFNKTRLAQSLAKSRKVQLNPHDLGRDRAEDADHWHRRLLRAHDGCPSTH